MKKTVIKALAIAAVLVGMLTIPIQKAEAASQGTKGDELQILEAEQLEVRLGEEWSGREFSLRTDVGEYPGVVTVNEEGVLKMEVGGSSQYILTLLHSSSNKEIADHAVPEKQTEGSETNLSTETTENETEENNENTVAGIPVAHLVMFSGGMVLAVTALILISVYKKKRSNEAPEEDDDL